MSPEEVYFVAASGVLGACVGSFLNVCIYRLPRQGLSIARPARSFCPTCGSVLCWSDNIPILSWLVLGGCCRSCYSPIAMRYLLVEATTALFFLFAGCRYLTGPEPSWSLYLVIVALSAALIAASFIDIDLRILPDEITLGGMMAAPFVVLLVPELHTRPVDASVSWILAALESDLRPFAARIPVFFRDGAGLGLCVVLAAGLSFGGGLLGYRSYWRLTRRGEARPLRHGLLGGVLAMAAGGGAVLSLLKPDLVLSPRLYSLWAALAGMLAGSGLVFLVGEVGSRVFRKPAMGFGDVKLMGLLGAFTGWAGVLAGFFLACLLGSVVGIFILLRYKSHYLPFGPFLALGCLATIFWPEAFQLVLQWYLGLF